jgi:hypothetical protein
MTMMKNEIRDRWQHAFMATRCCQGVIQVDQTYIAPSRCLWLHSLVQETRLPVSRFRQLQQAGSALIRVKVMKMPKCAGSDGICVCLVRICHRESTPAAHQQPDARQQTD